MSWTNDKMKGRQWTDNEHTTNSLKNLFKMHEIQKILQQRKSYDLIKSERWSKKDNITQQFQSSNTTNNNFK